VNAFIVTLRANERIEYNKIKLLVTSEIFENCDSSLLLMRFRRQLVAVYDQLLPLTSTSHPVFDKKSSSSVESRADQLSHSLLATFSKKDLVALSVPCSSNIDQPSTGNLIQHYGITKFENEELTAAESVSRQDFSKRIGNCGAGVRRSVRTHLDIGAEKYDTGRLHPLDYSADVYEINMMLSSYDKKGK
jgi:hypothetical protein